MEKLAAGGKMRVSCGSGSWWKLERSPVTIILGQNVGFVAVMASHTHWNSHQGVRVDLEVQLASALEVGVSKLALKDKQSTLLYRSMEAEAVRSVKSSLLHCNYCSWVGWLRLSNSVLAVGGHPV